MAELFAKSLPRPRWQYLVFYLTLLFFGGAVLARCQLRSRAQKPPDLDPSSRIREPSGVAYHEPRDTLFVVGDEGQLAELARNGELRRLVEIGGDLEGITVDAERDLLYLLDEEAATIVVVRVSDLAVTEVIALAPILAGAGLGRGKLQGLEGIAYQPGAEPFRLWIAHQHSPALLLRCRLGAGDDRIALEAVVQAPTEEISDLSVDPRTGMLLLASDREKSLFLVTATGLIIERRELGGADPEGVALLPDNTLIVADDNGGVWVF